MSPTARPGPEDAFKQHLADEHTSELIQRLKNPWDSVVISIHATGLSLKLVGGLIKDLEITGELWSIRS